MAGLTTAGMMGGCLPGVWAQGHTSSPPSRGEWGLGPCHWTWEASGKLQVLPTWWGQKPGPSPMVVPVQQPLIQRDRGFLVML